VTWIAADVTAWEPSRSYDLWHDRAAFHFLTLCAGPGGLCRPACSAPCVRADTRSSARLRWTARNDAAASLSGRYDAEHLAATLGRGFCADR